MFDFLVETADTGFVDDCTVTSLTNANNVQSAHSPILANDSSITNISGSRLHPRRAGNLYLKYNKKKKFP